MAKQISDGKRHNDSSDEIRKMKLKHVHRQNMLSQVLTFFENITVEFLGLFGKVFSGANLIVLVVGSIAILTFCLILFGKMPSSEGVTIFKEILGVLNQDNWKLYLIILFSLTIISLGVYVFSLKREIREMRVLTDNLQDRLNNTKERGVDTIKIKK